PARPAQAGRDGRPQPAGGLMPSLCARAAIVAAVLACAMAALPAIAQNSRETERKLENIKRELKSVAAERRRIEGERGAANRELRQADEKVGQSSRRLREIELQLA